MSRTKVNHDNETETKEEIILHELLSKINDPDDELLYQIRTQSTHSPAKWATFTEYLPTDIRLIFEFRILPPHQKITKMPKTHVSKSLVIEAPAHRVFSIINDFHHWSIWSPWLVAEPDAKVTVRDDGKFYEWEGNRTGAGEMTIVKEDQEKTVDYNLTFLKPWKSTAKVRFICQPDGQKTRVSWTMDSSLPFFMFWMKKSMEAFIGADFERGLTMLKEYVEKGKVNSKLEFKGTSTHSGGKYFGIKRDTTIANLKSMEADFAKIGEFVKTNNIKPSSPLFSMYHKWDIVKGQVSYTAGFPVEEIPDNLPTGFVTGEIPASKIYTLRHIGSYQHLGNAWTTMMMMQRNKEFKTRKDIHPFEVYMNMPGEVAEEELITDIVFAVKD